jgi:hypothetical protein
MLKVLRPGGWLLGESSLFDRHISMHKGDFIDDMQAVKNHATLVWYRVLGDPEATGRYAGRQRRTVVVRL